MKKSKLLKSLGFTSLAVFMGATALFAFAPLNNTSIAAGGLNASASSENQTFDLGLRPDTDPVVYVTESGLEIRKSNGKYTSTTTTTTNNGNSYTQDLTGFYYFTMGTFSGTIYTAKTQTDKYTATNEPVNWLIIGRGDFDFYDETAAGNSIKNDSSKQEFAVMNNLYLPLAMQSILEGPDNEIPNNCFLVISEKLLGQSYFNSTGTGREIFYTQNSFSYFTYVALNASYGNRYRYFASNATTQNAVGTQKWTTNGNAGGSLYNYINSLFSKNNSTGTITGDNKLGFTQAQADMIVPQQLYTYYSNGSGYNYQETPETDGGTYYTMFPLAYRGGYPSTYQNFCIEDYLPNANQRVASYIHTNQSFWYLLRTGDSGSCSDCVGVCPNGDYGPSMEVMNLMGVRPAMVIRIGG